MNKSVTTDQAEAFAEIIRRFIRHNSRMQASLPDELRKAKDILAAAKPSGNAERVDYLLLGNITFILGSRNEPISMGELSRELNVPLSTATRIIDWLVNTGFVERLPHPDDRRIVRIGLTPTGRGIYNARTEFMNKRITEWLQPLTTDERGTLIRLMQKLIDNLEPKTASD